MFAQYEELPERVVAVNVPVSTFADQKDQLFNFGWRFQYGPADKDAVIREDFDDSNWRALDLPHDFQFERPWDESKGGARGFKEMGEGWYRKDIALPKDWNGKTVWIKIGGIRSQGWIWASRSQFREVWRYRATVPLR